MNFLTEETLLTGINLQLEFSDERSEEGPLTVAGWGLEAV